jgi:hypothetical protein
MKGAIQISFKSVSLIRTYSQKEWAFCLYEGLKLVVPHNDEKG